MDGTAIPTPDEDTRIALVKIGVLSWNAFRKFIAIDCPNAMLLEGPGVVWRTFAVVGGPADADKVYHWVQARK